MITGNSHIVSFFDHCVGADNFSGTYLFVGPESVGKTHVALEIARAVQHLQSDDESLGRRVPRGALGGPHAYSCDCDSCSAILRGTHPDVLLFEKPLTVEDARTIKKQLAQSPLVAHFHIAIIPNIHLATAEAAQALLKLLEEPSPSTIFLLTAEHLSSVLPTIVSRSTTLHFSFASQKEMQPILPSGQKRKELEEIMPYWRGRPGRVIRLLEDAAETRQVLEEKKRAERFLQGTIAQRFSLAQQVASLEKPDAVAALEQWMLWWEEKKALTPLSALYVLNHSLARTPINIQTSLEYLAVRTHKKT